MQFSVDADHPCLRGHFPGHPIVPGVLILDRVLEAIESAHGPLPGSCDGLVMSGAADERVKLRLPQVKFLQPLLPGQTARIEIQAAADAPRWRFRVLRGDDLLASGEVRGR